MNDWKEPTDNTIDRVTLELRKPVRLADSFEVRVMSAVHADALARCDASHAERQATSEGDPRWWSRRYKLSISPLGALALAASLFGVIWLGSFARSSVGTQGVATTGATPPAEARNVRFILVDESAEHVFLVGDFNGWSKTATPLSRAPNGTWSVSVPLPRGRHEYAFVAHDSDGERWLADPLTPVVRDEFGTVSSVVRVDSGEAAASL